MSKTESEQFKSNEELFLHLIKTGFKNRGLKQTKEYIDRLKVEINVLKKGDVIDYFLVLYDIIQFAKRDNILTGIGRGSAGGSLVAYLLDIIQLDPIQFDLLFERFLNEGRMGEWVDHTSYTIKTDSKTIELIEGSLVRILRNGFETAVFVHELKEGDEILRY